jgi:hypothetical protein
MLKGSTLRALSVATAMAAAGVLGASTASAQHVFTNWDGDHLWSNAGNWNQDAPPDGVTAWINFTTDHALIDYAAPSIGELVIGQGGGDGHVRIVDGGSITTAPVNLAWGADRSGILDVFGGTMNIGQLRMGREAGETATVNITGGTLNTTGAVQLSSRIDGAANTPAGADSFLNMSGGTLAIGGIHTNQVQGTQNLEIGHLGGDATMTMTGGTVYANSVLVSNLGTSTATGTLEVTGGTLRALQIGVGPSGAGATGVGHFTIGGDAVVTTVNHIFLRSNGRGNFTVDGSNADIQVNRVGGTGFEVTNGSVVNFNADADGFSVVKIPASTMRFSGPDGVLNVDATALDIGVYDMFTFASYFSGDHNTATNRWGTENLTFAPGLSGSVLYNPQSIQLEVIPEPSVIGLLGLGGLAMLRRRRGS